VSVALLREGESRRCSWPAYQMSPGALPPRRRYHEERSR